MDTPAEMIGFAFYRRRLLLLYVSPKRLRTQTTRRTAMLAAGLGTNRHRCHAHGMEEPLMLALATVAGGYL